MNETGIWQRNYYEHIIRNDKDMQKKNGLHQRQSAFVGSG